MNLDDLYSLGGLTILAFALSLTLTPLVRDGSIGLGLLDQPDSRRKLHHSAVPRTGGVSILFSYVAAFGLFLLTPLKASTFLQSNLEMSWRLLPPIVLVLLTGLIDDWLNIRPWQKLAGQIAAAVWVYLAGVRILAVGGYAVPHWLGFLITIGWLVLCSNAFNLIDGMDGLAAGVGLSATLTIFFAGMIHGDRMLGFATAPLIGCLVGFLRYNFNPASIFLGDSGSLTIGFLLGTYGIIWSQKSATILGMTAPALALALPLIEVGLSIVRRFLGNEPIFSADRGHIHHRLLERGLTPKRAALLLYAVCGFGAAASLLQVVIRNRISGIITVLCAVAVWGGVRSLRYVEFAAARKFICVELRPMLGAHVKLESLERALVSATSVQQCWSAIRDTGRSLGYHSMAARLGGVRFDTPSERRRNATFWQMRLNLPQNDYVNITQREDTTEHPVLLMPFIEIVRRVLPEKLAELTARSRQPVSSIPISA